MTDERKRFKDEVLGKRVEVLFQLDDEGQKEIQNGNTSLTSMKYLSVDQGLTTTKKTIRIKMISTKVPYMLTLTYVALKD